MAERYTEQEALDEQGRRQWLTFAAQVIDASNVLASQEVQAIDHTKSERHARVVQLFQRVNQTLLGDGVLYPYGPKYLGENAGLPRIYLNGYEDEANVELQGRLILAVPPDESFTSSFVLHTDRGLAIVQGFSSTGWTRSVAPIDFVPNTELPQKGSKARVYKPLPHYHGPQSNEGLAEVYDLDAFRSKRKK